MPRKERVAAAARFSGLAYLARYQPVVPVMMASVGIMVGSFRETVALWLDSQIRFDRECETRVIDMILHNLSSLFGRTFETVHDLNRFRKALSAGLAGHAPA